MSWFCKTINFSFVLVGFFFSQFLLVTKQDINITRHYAQPAEDVNFYGFLLTLKWWETYDLGNFISDSFYLIVWYFDFKCVLKFDLFSRIYLYQTCYTCMLRVYGPMKPKLWRKGRSFNEMYFRKIKHQPESASNKFLRLLSQ